MEYPPQVFLHLVLYLCIIAASVSCSVMVPETPSPSCIGEYQRCPTTGTCVLIPDLCGIQCPAEKPYLCHISHTCTDDVSACPLNHTLDFWNTSLDIETRISILMETLSVEELVMQLQNNAPAIPRLDVPQYNYLNDDQHGVVRPEGTQFPNGCHLGAAWSTSLMEDVGNAVGFEARSMHNAFVHAGVRTGANGLGITLYAPNLNTVRDPRWGRAQEVFSEDPELTGRLTVHYVNGIQTRDSSGVMQAGACCKHFVAYDLESNPVSRFMYNAKVNARDMAETYLPAFEACIKESRATHVMCSYNALNGVPTCADKGLLTDLLRERWGFDGFVVSDYDAWAMIYVPQNFCGNLSCAAKVGIEAGMDQEGGTTLAINELPALVKSGAVPRSLVEQAFRRIFRIRFRLGMFDPPTTVSWNTARNTTDVVAKHRALARTAAVSGMVLLKNKNNTLPIPKSRGAGEGPLLVVGPRATGTSYLLGNYAVDPSAGVSSIVDGLLAAVSEEGKIVGGGGRTPFCSVLMGVTFVPWNTTDKGLAVNDAGECCTLCYVTTGCTAYTFAFSQCHLMTSQNSKSNFTGAISGVVTVQPQQNVVFTPGCSDYSVLCQNTSVSIPAAATLAAQARAVVVVLGLDQVLERESADRSNISLPDGQYALVRALRAATSKPLIGVLVHGGTFAMKNLTAELDAILDAHYPGMEGGAGLADVLFGDVSPAGRVSMTYYNDDKNLPPDLSHQGLYSNASTGFLGYTYRYYSGPVDFPFGFGLSYATFRYSLDAPSLPTSSDPCANITFDVVIENESDRWASDDVVQVYVSTPDATVPAPNTRLAAFNRVANIQPRQRRTVRFTVEPRHHSVVMDANVPALNAQRIVEAGRLEITVGGPGGNQLPPFTVNINKTDRCQSFI
eukprot:PhM_4_TR10387/c0_g1_i1/m.31063/K05349/bglX; beta-glucosidase